MGNSIVLNGNEADLIKFVEDFVLEDKVESSTMYEYGIADYYLPATVVTEILKKNYNVLERYRLKTKG